MPVLSILSATCHDHATASPIPAPRVAARTGPRLREITVQYTPKRGLDGRTLYVGPRMTDSLVAAHLLAQVLAYEPAEVFGILCLTTRGRVIGWHEVSRGTLKGVRVHVRDVLQTVLLTNAASIILAHNHPSGEAEPSLYDLHFTKRLIEVIALVGVEILDHIIIGDREFSSMRGGAWTRTPLARCHVGTTP